MKVLNVPKIKRRILPVVGVLTLSLILTIGCQKESLLDASENLDANFAKKELAEIDQLTDCLHANNCSSLLCLIKDEKNAQNDKINMVMYNYARAINFAAQQPGTLRMMYNALEKDQLDLGVPINDLASDSPDFDQILNEQLLESLSSDNSLRLDDVEIKELLNSRSDVHNYLQSKLTYDEDVYEPIIYFVNTPDQDQMNEAVTVVLGEQINECGEVAGWHKGELILLDEEATANSAGPVIFVDIANVEEDRTQTPVTINNDMLAESRATSYVSIQIDTRKIKLRYENDNNSEIHGWAIMTNNADTQVSGSNYPNFGQIHKNNIGSNGTTYYDDKVLIYPTHTQYHANKFFYGVYERDWAKSKKTVHNGCSGLSAGDAKVRMRYSHEWYFNSCASNPFGNIGPSNTSGSQTFDNSKCKIKVKATLI